MASPITSSFVFTAIVKDMFLGQEDMTAQPLTVHLMAKDSAIEIVKFRHDPSVTWSKLESFEVAKTIDTGYDSKVFSATVSTDYPTGSVTVKADAVLWPNVTIDTVGAIITDDAIVPNVICYIDFGGLRFTQVGTFTLPFEKGIIKVQT